MIAFLTQTTIFALIGGILPALVWLWFWLKEDKKHPEPKKLIFKTFVYGMLVVPIALIAQIIINEFILKNVDINIYIQAFPIIGTIVIILWALIEEFLKWFAAYFGGLHRRANDEPIDVLIYLITASLGFAALENTMFLFTPLLEGDTVTALITTNMRFIGATLVHVASSALLGVFMAFSYFFKSDKKHRYFAVGFTLSVALHTLFNLSIIKSGSLFATFAAIWLVVFVVIILFEKIKHIHLNKIKN